MELGPFTMCLFVSSDNVPNGSWTEEVLLFKSQFFTLLGIVIGIENWCDVLCFLSLNNGTVVVTGVELSEVKLIARSGSPQSQVVCVKGVETWNRGVIGLGYYDFTAFPDASLDSSIVVLSHMAVESNLIGDVGSLDFPRVTSAQPVIRWLYLIPVNDSLLEYTIIVSNTITPSWDF